MSDKRRKTNRSAKSHSLLVGGDVKFAEIQFPHTTTSRRVTRYGEELSLRVENQATIPLVAGFITALRALEQGGAL